MKTERVKNSIYNGISDLLCNLSITIFSFIVRTIFIRKLGEQCLGLDGLFTNILSLLSLADLGFSTAISFSLYEPLARNNNEHISAIMAYFKKVYKVIAFIILGCGLCLIPFLKYCVNGYDVNYNIYLIYILYLINTVSSYFTSYNNVLLEADQKLYKLTGIRLFFNFLVYGIQLIILLLTSNFILYLIAQFLLRQIERIIKFNYIKNIYKNINFNSKDSICDEDKKGIKKNIKGILFHKIGNYVVNGTDNIIISSIINISTTGIYSNYLSIVTIFRNLIGSVISATTSSFGNLNVLSTEKAKENSFKMVNFVCYTITGYVLVCLFFCINPFINIWIGSKYSLNTLIVLIICINFYLNCLMLSVDAVKTSAGLYYVDRYVPIIQAIINLTISIALGIKIGLLGVLLGTCISSVLTVNIIKPIIIYKYVFKSSVFNYFENIIKNILLIIISIGIELLIFRIFTINNLIVKFLIYGIITSVVYGVLFIIFYFNSDEFKYFQNMLRDKFKRS